MAFKDVFFALATPHGLGQIQRKIKNPVFITFFGSKDCSGFKGRREMSRYQVVPFAISANFGCNLSTKVYASENPCKNAIFWLVFSAKNLVKSDKLALIEGKILNLTFFDINIPVVPNEIWLRLTHNQSQKTLKVASVLLFRHIFKTKSWLECGFSFRICDRAFTRWTFTFVTRFSFKLTSSSKNPSHSNTSALDVYGGNIYFTRL